MTTLVIHGNTNQFTFANAIVAANWKSKEKFDNPLENIYIIHSNESDRKLRILKDWLKHLEKHHIEKEVLIERVIEVTSHVDSIKKFAEYLESIMKGSLNGTEVMVDLSNGTTFQKNVLSIASYILDIRNQFLVDIVKLSNLTDERGFLSQELLSSCYIEAPDYTHLDSIAYLNLAEIVRYKKIIKEHTSKFTQIDEESADEKFFRDNLIHSIQLKLQGDINKDNAVYRIAASSIAASLEELISLLIKESELDTKSHNKGSLTFGRKLRMLESLVKRKASSSFDPEFFQLFNDFVLYLRNSSTHKGRLLTNLEKFKAELSVKMTFPFMEFYTDIIFPIISQGHVVEHSRQLRKVSHPTLDAGEKYYYGLDGDDTGAVLEKLFLSSDDEHEIRRQSKTIENAIVSIGKLIRKRSIAKNEVIIEAGDDLLFKGSFDLNSLQSMQKMYNDTTGLTCSIGYGRSIREVYLALKLAKAEPGKNSIVGIEMK